MTSAAVAGAFDPDHDGDPQLLAGIPGAPVEDVLLQQAEEALHGGVVTGRADTAHRSDQAVPLQRPLGGATID